MTITLPRLRIKRQFSQILRTEALTFICLESPKKNNFNKKVSF
jgi:hypothetical protein